MNLTFKVMFCKPWTVTDTKLIYGKSEYLFTDIVKIENVSFPKNANVNGTIGVHFSDGKYHVLGFPYNRSEDAKVALQFLMDNAKKVEVPKATQASTQDSQEELLQKLAEKNGYKLTAREMQLMALNAGCMESTALNAAAGFNHIAGSVRSDEKVVFCIATGPIYARQHSLGNSAVVLTESRIIFAGGTSDFVKTVSSFSLDLGRIDAVDMQAQMMAYNLMITASGEQTKCTFAALKNESGARLLNEFINAVYDCKKAKSEVKQQTNIINQVSAADELKKFKELLDLGIITQEEFDAKKKQLLGL